MARGPCRGNCPIYDVRISTNGWVSYRGDEYVLVRGYRSAMLSPTSLEALRRALERSKILAMDAACCNCDGPSHEETVSLAINQGVSIKEIEHYYGCESAPNAVTVFEAEIDSIVGVERWIGSPEARRKKRW